MRLCKWAPELIILEVTDGYELLSAVGRAVAALPVVVVNPRQVRNLARATGQLAKTDRVFAEILVRAPAVYLRCLKCNERLDCQSAA